MSFIYFYLFILIVHPIAAMWWKSFSKLNEANWKAFIPFLNYYVVFKHGAAKPWWCLLMLFPGVHLVMWMAGNVSYMRRFGFFSLGDTIQGILFPYLILSKIANEEKITALPMTNWANPVEVAKRTNGDHVVLFLCLPVIGHAVAYLLSFRSKRIGKKSVIKEWGDSILFALVAASIIRTYVFEPFQIPTGSMEKTLLVGDFLFVNKLAYGPKVPVTPLSYPLVHNTVPWIVIKSYTSFEKGSYFRLPGFSSIHRNDVMVFNYPSGDTAVYDPRVPDGLMGHDYHGVLIHEAEFLFSESYSTEKRALAYKIEDSIRTELAKQNFVANPDYLRERAYFLAQRGILEIHGDEFIKDYSLWKNKARDVLSNQKIAHTQQGVISHYGLIPRPVDKRENYIKRCVAVPNDLIEIRYSVLYVNGKPAWKAPDQNLQYDFESGEPLSIQKALSMGLTKEDGDFITDISETSITTIFLTKEKKTQLKRIAPNSIFKLNRSVQYSDDLGYKPKPIDLIDNLEYFPKDFYINNTVTDFNPIRIPKKGSIIRLTAKNIAWYRRIITAYEGHKLEERKDGIYIDGKKTSTYKIQMNYYWLMGDNRYNSADSRVWGFVPEDHVVGKASIVWFSKGSNGVRWDRVFKIID